MDYAEFLEGKAQSDVFGGFDPVWMPSFLYDFQAELVDWVTRKGRGGIFADCGLGKTPMQLVWAENVVRKTNRPVLIATPLAVTYQILKEAAKFDIQCERSKNGEMNGSKIIATNYEKLHLFDPNDFAGVVCDESSILKNFAGVRRQAITEFMRTLPHRLLCTATAAPNDYIELGTSSEALGELGHTDMLSRFFKNDLKTSNSRNRMYGAESKWRFRGHAEQPFWRWVTSWARALRRPSDLGFDDSRFELPPLTETQHTVTAITKRPDMLFDLPAVGLQEQREERRRTIKERCERVASLIDHKEQALVWCHLNDEGDLLADLIPDAKQVKGSDSDDKKEELLLAFANGDLRVLVTKPKIGAWGLNLQRCAHVTFFPSHSYEQYYQGVRRCWRFGQDRPVVVDVITTEGEANVMKNLQRKAKQADQMFESLTEHMRDSLSIKRPAPYKKKVKVPEWL